MCSPDVLSVLTPPAAVRAGTRRDVRQDFPAMARSPMVKAGWAAALTSQGSGKQFQRRDVGWGHCAEVTLVESGHLARLEPFGHRDH